MSRRLAFAPLATLVGLVVHYLLFYLAGVPLWTETIAEWIMARTPSSYAVPVLTTLGPWAKPFAMTGALAILGFAVSVSAVVEPVAGCLLAALVLGWGFQYWSWMGQLSFWFPAAAVLRAAKSRKPVPQRREFLTAGAMAVGVIAVAAESYARDSVLAQRAVEPVDLFPFHPPDERFGLGLVRKAVTPVAEFYGMSKNTVDPVVDPRTWRLRITADGQSIRSLSYADLLSLPRVQRCVTLRCISNTLSSDLMGTAEWSGVLLNQLVDARSLPGGLVEMAVIGVDGHGDSFSLDYAFSDELLLALGMNGRTLNRTHGFPLRLLAPRYYGFKNVKWIGEISFRSTPYLGTWPKLGYAKEPLVHTSSHIDRVMSAGGIIRAGGVSFAGIRGIRQVQLRADGRAWADATLEQPLSPYTWTRWQGSISAESAKQVEARALDGMGQWQDAAEGPLFPDGVRGPTIRRIG